MVTDINLKYQKGLSVSSLLPKIDLSFVKDLKMSPFVADQWVYFGVDIEKSEVV